MPMKPTVETEKTEQGVAWTSPDGERHDYYHTPRSLWLQVQELQLVHCTDWLGKNNAVKAMRSVFKGKAILRESIEVIGIPESRSHQISIWFRDIREGYATRLSAEKGEEAPKLFQPASVCYLGEKDGWQITIQLSPEQFQGLLDAYKADRIKEASTVIFSPKIYVKSQYEENTTEARYISPSSTGDCSIWAEFEGLSVVSALLCLHNDEPVEKTIQAKNIVEVISPVSEDRSIQAVATLNGKLDRVSSLLKVLITTLLVATCALIIFR